MVSGLPMADPTITATTVESSSAVTLSVPVVQPLSGAAPGGLHSTGAAGVVGGAAVLSTVASCSSQASRPTAPPKPAPAPNSRDFSCVVLTDWLVHPEHGPSPKSEILEFSWAVYDIHSECLLEKVRHVVCPTETPGGDISESLLKTLKLTDSRPLERAKSLKQVLTEFDTACSMVSVPSVCVVAGSVKLRDHLLAETFRKGVPVPKCLRSVVDLATLAAHFYPMQFAGVTKDILSPRDIATHLSANVSPQEEEFSSMDGCMTMCQIIKKMHLDNIHFQPQHLSTVVTSPTTAPSEATTGAKPLTTGTAAVPTAIPTPTTPQQPSDCIVRMRGVPWGVTEADVVKFMEPVCTVTPGDVHIVTNYDGKASGEVYVRVASMEHRDKCLQELHGRYMGPRWIEVFKASQGDFHHFPMFREVDTSDKRGALRLRGLPWSTNEYEIVRFFSEGGFHVDINSVVLGQSHDNRFNGDAWVLLDSTQTADEARRVLHKKTLGRRYVELFQSTPREVEIVRRGPVPQMGRSGYERPSPYGMGSAAAALAAAAAAAAGSPATNIWGTGHPTPRGPGNFGGPSCGPPVPPVMSCHPGNRLHGSGNASAAAGGPIGGIGMGSTSTGPPGECRAPGADVLNRHTAPAAGWGNAVVRLRGLPYHANENHIVEFFHGYAMSAILPATAPIDGRPSGEAYVEFVSPEEAWRALKSRNGALMDRRYIELFPATKQEMELAAAGMDPREIRSRCPRP